jgi:hypothetical protein
MDHSSSDTVLSLSLKKMSIPLRKITRNYLALHLYAAISLSKRRQRYILSENFPENVGTDAGSNR